MQSSSYIRLAQDADQFDEKAVPLSLDTRQNRPTSLARLPMRSDHLPSPTTAQPPQFFRQPQFTPPHRFSQSRIRNRYEILTLVRPWVPLILYAITSLAFLVAIALYRTELFTYLDELSMWLRSDEQYGYAVLFFLIFLTTIPPIPLYSTLIVLSGYTFGAWIGAIISYFSALLGALVVFIISRVLFRECIEHWLSSYPSIKRVVRAIEKRPKLLFLIRLAPYPYNVMNCLLAASSTLTLHTYTVCTALSLFKVIIHTSLGASIHSFRDYSKEESSHDENSSDMVARLWTILGIALCILILVYLSVVARRAVDDELDDIPVTARDPEETLAFLAGGDNDVESAHPSRYRPMTEIPFRTSSR